MLHGYHDDDSEKKEISTRAPAILLLVQLLLPRSTIALQSTSIFRSDTRLVQINVVVRDKHGPVTNLSRNNFALMDNGRLQDIRLFSMNSAALANERADALPTHTFSNSEKNGAAVASVTVVLLDALNTLVAGHEAYEETPTWNEDLALADAKQHLAKFVAQMQPSDLLAIYILGHNLIVLSDFTNDRQKLLALLNNYKPASLTRSDDAEPLAVHTPVPGDFNASVDRQRRNFAAVVNGNRAEETMRALSAIAGHLSGIPGRKNLVWLTANLPFSETAAATALSRAGVAVYPVDARGLLTAMPARTDVDLFSQMMRRSSVATGQRPEPTGISQMLTLAQETGGRAFVNTNDLTGAIREIVAETAVTYTLGFYPAAGTLDGKFHLLKVKVRGHSGLEVRYPSGYFAVKDDPTRFRQNGDLLASALSSPLDLSAVHIQAHVESSGQPDAGSFEIAGSIRLSDIGLTQDGERWRGTLMLYVVQQDVAGNVLAQSENGYQLQLTKEMYLRYSQSGLPFRCSITSKPGFATLRILVRGPLDGVLGSLIIPVSAIR